jgi:uncharacterized protein YndB with AHSA1/START domain
VTVTSDENDARVVSATRDISASAEPLFELIADPAQRPRFDRNAISPRPRRPSAVRAIGAVFEMMTKGT